MFRLSDHILNIALYYGVMFIVLFALEYKEFKRIVFNKLNWQIDRPSYSTRCALFGLSSLESRRKMFSVWFARVLVHVI